MIEMFWDWRLFQKGTNNYFSFQVQKLSAYEYCIYESFLKRSFQPRVTKKSSDVKITAFFMDTCDIKMIEYVNQGSRRKK